MSHAETEDIKFGVSGGATVSKFSKSENNQFRLGFHIQAFWAYQLNQYLDAPLTIAYSAKGNRISTKGDNRKEYNQNFDYLQTTVQLNIFPGADRQYFFVTGGYAGYLLAAKEHKVKYVNNQKKGAPKPQTSKQRPIIN